MNFRVAFAALRMLVGIGLIVVWWQAGNVEGWRAGLALLALMLGAALVLEGAEVLRRARGRAAVRAARGDRSDP